MATSTFVRAVFLLLLYSSVDVNAERKNLVFITIDDLRYEDEAPTPFIDALARQGVKFTNAHANVPLCGPSRASLFTGRKPNELCYYHHKLSNKRKRNMDSLILDRAGCETLPEYLQRFDYDVFASGKVFHHMKDNYKIFGDSKYYKTASEQCDDDWLFCRINKKDAEDFRALEWGKERISNAIEKKKNFAFFYGVRKPHMPYRVPDEVWEELGWVNKYGDLPKLENAARSDPYSISNYYCSSMRRYLPIKSYKVTTQLGAEPYPEELALQIRKAYFAAVKWADSLVGNLTNYLEKQNVFQRTLVVLFSDNGFLLGEQGGWCKQVNFDIATKVPLIVYDPASKNREIDHAISLLDLYSTTLELLDLPKKSCIQGTSFGDLVRGNKRSRNLESYVFSLVARCIENIDSKHKRQIVKCSKVDSINYMGYSVRTNRWRYTEWHKVSGGDCKVVRDWNKTPLEVELYDHHRPSEYSPGKSELFNLINVKDQNIQEIKEALSTALRIEFGGCNKNCDLTAITLPEIRREYVSPWEPPKTPDGSSSSSDDDNEVLTPTCDEQFCPANSIKKSKVECAKSMNDCKCIQGFKKKDNMCRNCNTRECPNKYRPKSKVQCITSFRHCECDVGFVKRGKRCRPCDKVTCPADTSRQRHCLKKLSDCG